MGKRKERRRAALSNTGRRVKLDLFAEPSGNLGGSPEHNEVGGDQIQSAGLPDSPSSSGQQSENPLLLLGQYSDDEMDEESNKTLNHATEENTTADHDDQVLVGEKDIDANVPEDLTAEKLQTHDVEKTFVENQKNPVSADVDPCKEMGPTEIISNTGDVCFGWKMVLHAESNQYYYWNTETGETSWEIPEVLSQSADMSSDQKNLTASNTESEYCTLTSELGNSSASLIVDGSLTTNLPSQCKEVGSDEWAEDKSKTLEDGEIDNGDQTTDTHHNELKTYSDAMENTGIDSFVNGEHQKANDICTQLVKQAESLLDKLKSLQGSKGRPQGNDWVQKHILEVEIRLSDIKSLFSYGSPLLPFWEYSERQLKRLEAVINNEIYELAVFSQMDDGVPAPIFSLREKGCQHENVEYESKAAGNEQSMVSDSLEASLFEKDAQHVLREGSIPKPDFVAEEDVDMDVDMEVEVTVPAGNTASGNGTDFNEQPAVYTPLVSENVVPPPPDEEWIPPPPPDNEQAPPPPPDEPPEIPYTSYVDTTGQPLNYAGQYNLTYQDPNLQYYGHFYGHVGVNEIALPQTSLHYEAVPVGTTYSDSALVIANPIETASYYGGIQDGTLPPVPGYESHTPDQIASTGARNVAGPDIIKVDDLNVIRGIENGSVGPTSTSVPIQIPVISVKENITAPTNADVVAKAEPKVPRTKKRSVAVATSFRSNKKVSSLVDKWKAAKEELNEAEEEEPTNALAILEKKRQREIEEWKAQQIATGEAKENANFQPLGGDWFCGSGNIEVIVKLILTSQSIFLLCVLLLDKLCRPQKQVGSSTTTYRIQTKRD